jgi:hypothetical protein
MIGRLLRLLLRLLGLRRARVLPRRRGRPRIGEERRRPWEGTGLSERTWYRRQREARGV